MRGAARHMAGVAGIDTRDLGIVCDKDEIKWQKKGPGFRFLAVGRAIAGQLISRSIGRIKKDKSTDVSDVP